MPTANDKHTPRHRDHELMILGEALADMNRQLGGELSEVDRADIVARWLDLVQNVMPGIDSKTQTGRRIKAGAILVYSARTDGYLPHSLVLSLVADVLGTSLS